MKNHPTLTFLLGIATAFAMAAAALPFVEERVAKMVEDGTLAERVTLLERQAKVPGDDPLKPATTARGDDAAADAVRISSVEKRIQSVEWQVGRAHQRLNDARLVSEDDVTGPAYGCGHEDTKEAPFVMVGRRDGCGTTQSLNYYRRFSLRIPPP